MITRPLDLASKLRPEPRNYDWLFFVNAGLIILFFVFFGSRFVLSPGLNVEFRLPTVRGANAAAMPTSDTITIENEGQILAGDGRRDMEQVRTWLADQAKLRRAKRQRPVLLIQASGRVAVAIAADIAGEAQAEGFEVIFAANELKPSKGSAIPQ